jgi:hypothetical protein
LQKGKGKRDERERAGAIEVPLRWLQRQEKEKLDFR